MASVFSHTAIPVALRLILGRSRVSNRLLAAGCLTSAAPDLDSAGFRFGVEYASQWGHRGFTHSLAFALAAGVLAALLSQRLSARREVAFALIFLSMASHGVLDAMTTGGLGIAFFWPWDHGRYFLPWRGIEVSPLNASRFFTARGLTILKSEVVWIWLPAFVLSVPFLVGRYMSAGRSDPIEGD